VASPWPSGGVEGVTVISRWDNVEPSSPANHEGRHMNDTDKIVAAILAAAKCIGSTENTVDNLMAQYAQILPKVRERSEEEALKRAAGGT
jgi:hypothetical protein